LSQPGLLFGGDPANIAREGFGIVEKHCVRSACRFPSGHNVGES
jgi:hypothetical protein